MDNYSEELFWDKVDYIYQNIIKGKFPVLNDVPTAVLLGGQPGSGKTMLHQMYSYKMNGNIVLVNGDEFRRYHPYFKEIKYLTEDYVSYTGKFSGRVTEALIEILKKKSFNILVEGTLRTVEVPISTCRLLKEEGYRTQLSIMATKPELSYIGTLKRYEQMKLKGQDARKTSRELHDLIVERLPENLNQIYKMQEFDQIFIYDREGICLFNSEKDKQLPGDVLKEFFQTWTLKEIEMLKYDIEKIKELKVKNGANDILSFTEEMAKIKNDVIIKNSESKNLKEKIAEAKQKTEFFRKEKQEENKNRKDQER